MFSLEKKMVSFTNQYHFLRICDLNGERMVALDAATYSIGRDSSNALILHDPSVSRHHCLLLRIPRGRNVFIYRLVDGDARGKASTNGTRINSSFHLSKVLESDDIIQLGDHASCKYMVVNMSPEEFDKYYNHKVLPFHSIQEEMLDPTGTLQHLSKKTTLNT